MKKMKYAVLFVLIAAAFASTLSYAGFVPEQAGPAATYAEKASRLRSVFEYLLSVSEGGEDLSVSLIKPVTDFAGNPYYVAECEPTGYIIYCESSGIFTEYSMTALSPYRNAEGTLYYGGPTYYYVQEEGSENAAGLLYPDEFLTKQEREAAAEENKLFYEYNMAQKNTNVLNYVEAGNAAISFAQHMSTIPAPAAMEYGKLTHPAFFMDNTSPCGYVVNCCAYTALAMQIAYRDKYRDTKYMDDIYWYNSSHTKLCDAGASFAYELRLHYGSSDGVTINQIKEISEAYCKDRGISVTHTAKGYLGFSRSTIMNAIDNDTPVMLGGSFTDPSSGKKYDHAVVAYAYHNNTSLFGTTTYVVHFGANGYSNVTLSETISGIYMLG